MHEEKDYCMRLLRTNSRVYYTPQVEVLHKVSPEKRYESNERVFYYGIRNDFWIYIRNAPFFFAFLYLAYLTLSVFPYSIKKKSFKLYIKGVLHGFFSSMKAWQQRNPLSYAQFKEFNKLEAKKRDPILVRIRKFLSL
jgi:GT2 family glycosyltransferase